MESWITSGQQKEKEEGEDSRSLLLTALRSSITFIVCVIVRPGHCLLQRSFRRKSRKYVFGNFVMQNWKCWICTSTLLFFSNFPKKIIKFSFTWSCQNYFSRYFFKLFTNKKKITLTMLMYSKYLNLRSD